MNFEEFKSRKDLQITAIISFLIGCLLNYYGLILFAIGTIIFLIWRWKNAKKEQIEKG